MDKYDFMDGILLNVKNMTPILDGSVDWNIVSFVTNCPYVIKNSV